MGALEGGDALLLREQEAQLVHPLQQAVAGEWIDGERGALPPAVVDDRLRAQVDRHLDTRVLEQERVRGLVDHHRQQAILHRVAAEDVGDGEAHHRAEAVVGERPGRVLARGAAAEVLSGHQHPRALRPGFVEREPGPRASLLVEPPVGEQRLAEALAGDALEEAGGDDLIGVDVGLRQDHGLRRERLERLAPSFTTSRGSAMAPRPAAAAAVSGLARKVRAFLPCRPSKLRLLVLTAVWPGPTMSPFIAMHIEHPGSRHSAPASRKTRSRPSRSAALFTRCEPGTPSARTPVAPVRPRSPRGARRRSWSRELVQLPMNTTSTGWPSSLCPGRSPM